MEELYVTDKGKDYIDKLQTRTPRNSDLGMDLSTLVLIDGGDLETIYTMVNKYPRVKTSLRLLIKDGYVDVSEEYD